MAATNLTRPAVQSDTPDTLGDQLEHLRTFDARLWDHAPGVARARARHARYQEAARTLTDALSAAGTVVGVLDHALDDILEGQPVEPERLHADLVAAMAGKQAEEGLNNVLQTRAVSLQREVFEAEQIHAPAALASLHGTLLALVDVGRSLIPLATLTGSLADAGNAGQARVLLEAAAAVHDQLRRRQVALTVSPNYAAGPMVRRFGIVRDVSTLAPWAEKLATASSSPTWGSAPDLEELVDRGGLDLFRLVCQPDLHPWVPTEPELRKAAEAMRLRVERAQTARDNPHVRIERDEDSRATITVGGARQTQAVKVSARHDR